MNNRYDSVVVPNTAKKIVSGYFYASVDGLQVTTHEVKKDTVEVSLGYTRQGGTIIIRKDSALVLSEFFAELHKVLE